MRETISDINQAVNSFVWGLPVLSVLIMTGVLMTTLTGFFQVRHMGHWIRETLLAAFSKDTGVHDKKDRGAISQFQALCTALAATIGVGNIAGVATAIVSGGPGAVFWMWAAAFFGMMTRFSENVLGIYFRRKNEDGEWAGGAMYYLRDGLGRYKGCRSLGKALSGMFCLCCVLASFGIGNASQVNTIAKNMHTVFSVSPWLTGILLMILAGLVIVGGIKRMASVTEKLVPFMAIAYMAGTLILFFSHIEHAGAVFSSILRFAFGLDAFAGGAAGISVKQAVTWGVKRGVFSNEAGLGSSVMVHSASNVKEPVQQGMWGIFEVFTDTMIVCTLTAFVVLSSGFIDLESGIVLTDSSASALVSEAFSAAFGPVGGWFVAVAILLFAFSTVLGWSYYGTKAWEFLFNTRSTFIYKIVFVLFIAVGATMNLDLAWDISDSFNGLMAIPNLIGVLALTPLVLRIMRNYTARTFRGEHPRPLLSYDALIQSSQEKRH